MCSWAPSLRGLRRRSCMPTWTPSSPRSSSGTTRGCEASRSSSAAVWCWRPVTRRRRAGSPARWAEHERGDCARTRSSSSRGWRPTPGPARTSSRYSGGPPHSSKACPSTRRSWTSVGWPGCPAHRRHRRETASGRAGVGRVCRSPWVSARTKFLAKVASGVAKPDGLLVVQPARRNWPSCTRCRCSGCGASARRAPRSCTSWASSPSGRSPVSARPGWCRSSGQAPAGTCTRWRTTATRAGCASGAVADRSARSTPWAARGTSPATSTPWWWAWSTG